MSNAKLSAVAALILGSSLAFAGCGDEEAPLGDCVFPQDSSGASLVGNWSGTATLYVAGAAVNANISIEATPLKSEAGTCSLHIALAENTWRLCGATFEGIADWDEANGRWSGSIQTVNVAANGPETTFKVGMSPVIGDRLALSVEITQSTVQVCQDRTIQGDLPRIQ